MSTNKADPYVVATDKLLRGDLEGSFRELVLIVLDTPDMMQEYRRLYGTRFGLPREPIVEMVDKATGYYQDEAFKFFGFVQCYVFEPWATKVMREAVSAAERFS